jgi:hypothetical protein
MQARGARPRSGILASLALLAAMACLAGCGTVPYPNAAARWTPAPHTAIEARHLGPPGGSRAQAAALAASMLSRLVLPAGARREPARPLPRSLRQPGQIIGALHFVDLIRIYRLPMPMAQAAAFLQAHTPTGLKVSSTGGGELRGVPTSQDVGDVPRRLPSYIDAAELFYTVVPADGDAAALLRLDAQVIWYPARSAAEYIQPASFRSVSITVYRYLLRKKGCAGLCPQTVRRTVGSRAVVATLARVVDSLHGYPPGPTLGCTLFGDYMLTFNATDSRDDIFVAGSGCGWAQVSVGSAKQPELSDPDKVYAVANRLLRSMQAARPTRQLGRRVAAATARPSY